jgi:hypothetical protein
MFTIFQQGTKPQRSPTVWKSVSTRVSRTTIPLQGFSLELTVGVDQHLVVKGWLIHALCRVRAMRWKDAAIKLKMQSTQGVRTYFV